MLQRNKSSDFNVLKQSSSLRIEVLPTDRSKINWIVYSVIIQCFGVFFGTATVFECVWKPERGYFDLDVLARIMYLYDTEECGTSAHLDTKPIVELTLSDKTYGLKVLAIRRAPIVLTVLSKLSGKTRTYLTISCIVHSLWLIGAVITRIFSRSENFDYLKFILKLFYCQSIMVVCFDICMGIVYVAHIQQALTKAMIIRYSGWGLASGIEQTDEFGGWVPLIASACWMRGIFIMLLNIYCCRVIRFIIGSIRKREVRSRITDDLNIPFPDTTYNEKFDQRTLHFRSGERKPYSYNSY